MDKKASTQASSRLGPGCCSLARINRAENCTQTPHKYKRAYKRTNRNNKMPACKRVRVVQEPSRHAGNNIRAAAHSNEITSRR
jgi:hypothetical protein